MAGSRPGDRDAVAKVIEDWARERPELDTSPLEVLARLHRSFLRYSTRLTTSIERHGLSVAGFDVLTALRRSGKPFRLTAGQLADSGLVSSAGVTLRIDRLEKDGLIVRERDADDRRVVYSRLTDKGLTTVDTVFAEHLDNERRMLGGLSPSERRQLARLLRRLEDSILESDEEPPGAAQ
ncbi:MULTISPECIES: MarR family winged helix-turn-helix transcriptional regulator [Streptomyces]|uniref:MarR family winged helix-turn-helix transcriptional regulator n=1 Tax=Streptomyces yanii TaxID=78510 RepID=A0ABV5R7R9_9ACTN|nr:MULTISPECIES: MarR family transcriptional regulator [unclassified Streptomyces]MCX4530534.1 MarR family transcriptional regulator [Streptomyces sp. NBC_01669]WSA03711.1 MarR family transcriptional regulator [Streptomyces sp. NBC_00841]